MALLVHSPGAYSVLVDPGRPQTRALGMPVGGAADRAAYVLGNALVGNPADAVALEFALAGPTLEAMAEHGCVVWGAEFRIWINDRSHDVGKTFTLRPGDVLTIAAAVQGLRGYLCVRGGFEAPAILDSRSALDPIEVNEVLNCPPGNIRPRYALVPDDPAGDANLLRVLPGTHTPLFPLDQFLAEEYIVQEKSNRMGLRLTGKPLPRPDGEQLSAPVCPGTVQITHDGQPIVLGVDAQTIGGYARIAHVIGADLDKLAQFAPGERLRFAQIELAEAVTLWRQREAWLREWGARLRSSWF